MNYGSKRAPSSARTTACATGWQRIVTAVLMALFTLVLLVQVLLPGGMGYDKWAASSRRQG